MTDREHPELLRFLDSPPNTWTIQRTRVAPRQDHALGGRSAIAR